jgi:hypothetical protein
MGGAMGTIHDWSFEIGDSGARLSLSDVADDISVRELLAALADQARSPIIQDAHLRCKGTLKLLDPDQILSTAGLSDGEVFEVVLKEIPSGVVQVQGEMLSFTPVAQAGVFETLSESDLEVDQSVDGNHARAGDTSECLTMGIPRRPGGDPLPLLPAHT